MHAYNCRLRCVDPDERIKQIAEQLQEGAQPEPVTVRELLRWFHSERRGSWIVSWIRSTLQKAGVQTVPDFNSVWLDAMISFELLPPPDEGKEADTSEGDEAVVGQPGPDEEIPEYGEDPTYRIGKLHAANLSPVSVARDAPFKQVVTELLLNDVDLIVVKSGERSVKGVVTWSSIGRRLALGEPCETAKDCMDTAITVESTSSLFTALPQIVEHGYVLVQDTTGNSVGLVTTRDLSLQFHSLSEPFLLLGEIENHLRIIVSRGPFTHAEIAAAKDPSDEKRNVEQVADLTFGELVRFIAKEETWNKLGLRVSRTETIKWLQDILEIRNDVMHFDPDPLGEESMMKLRQFTQFLRTLADARSPESSSDAPAGDSP